MAGRAKKAEPAKAEKKVVIKKEDKAASNVAPGSKASGATRVAKGSRPGNRGTSLPDPNEKPETFTLASTSLPYSSLTSTAALNMARAAIIVEEVMRGGKHLFARMCLKLGFVPTVPAKMEETLGHKGVVTVEELSAWATAHYLSSEAQEAMRSEFQHAVRRKVFNPTRALDIIEIREGVYFIKDTADLTEEQKDAISEVIPTRNGVQIKLFDQASFLRLFGAATGSLIEKQERSGPNGAPETAIKVNATTPQEAAEAYQALMQQGSKK